MSMLPPCAPGGTECGRSSRGDGDAHDAEERASGNRMPRSPPSTTRERAEPVVVLVLLDGREHADVARPQRVLPGERTAAVPVGDHAVRHARRGSTTVIASRSPGSAPRTRIGPVTTCGSVRRRVARVSRMPRAPPRRRARARVRRRVRRSTPPGRGPGPRGCPRGSGCRSTTASPGSTVEHGRAAARGQSAPAQRPRLGRKVRRCAVDGRTRLQHPVKSAHPAPVRVKP